MTNSTEVSSVYSPDGQWLWTGQEWVPAPPAGASPRPVPAAPIVVREQKSVGQQVGNGVAMFGLIVVVIFMVIVGISIAASI